MERKTYHTTSAPGQTRIVQAPDFLNLISPGDRELHFQTEASGHLVVSIGDEGCRMSPAEVQMLRDLLA